MSTETGHGGGRKIVVAVIAALIALIVGVMTRGLWQGQPEVVQPAVAPVPEVTAVAIAPAPEAAQVAEPKPVEEAALPVPPSIDVVRVDAEGGAVIAGKAAAGSQVAILLDGVEVALADADASGRFVSLLTLPPSDAGRSLSLMQRQPDGAEVAGAQQVVLAPVAAPKVEVETVAVAAETPVQQAPAESSGTTEVAEAPAETGESSAAVAPTPAPATEPQPEPAQPPAVLLADATGVRVLQPAAPQETSPEVMSAVALDAITYSDVGEVELSGRAQGSGFVRVYVDNKPVVTAPIREDGNWRTDLPDVDTGVYTLRVDEVDQEGRVTSRVETPFKREDEAVIAAAPTQAQAPGAPAVRVVTVQPGSTLWAIARANYGDGQHYVRVFQANRDRIRDPDLIYPGQVFTVPTE